MKRNAKTLVVGQKPTIYHQVLSKLMNKSKDGVITLEKFTKAFPAALRSGCVDFLRKAHGGDFIEGRRGHPSRFVFGEALEHWNHQEEIRREWRIRNGKNPETGGPLHPARRSRQGFGSVRPTVGQKSGMLVVTVGSHTTKIPVKSLGLVAA